MEYLERQGMTAIQAYEKDITAYTLTKLREVSGIKIYGETNPSKTDNRVGVISFNLDNIHHSLVAAALAWEGGIAVRSGCFCAHPYVISLLNLSPHEVARVQRRIRAGDRSGRPGMVRISLAAYNNRRDIDRAVHTLKRIKEMAVTGELYQKYKLCRENGEYYPANTKLNLDRFYTLSPR